MKKFFYFYWVLISSTLIVWSSQVFACSVCYGDPNSRMTQGLKMAVLALLMIVTVVLSLFVIVVMQMRKRAEG